MTDQASGGARTSLTHAAFFYETAGQYARDVGGFIRAGLRRAEPVMAVVPAARLVLLRNELGSLAEGVTFADMTALGRNPGRVIPAMHAFVGSHRGQPVRYIGEPVWHGRSAAEQRESIRNETLVNEAFAHEPVSVLCPYDIGILDPELLAGAERTHPVLMGSDRVHPSPAFGTAGLAAGDDVPLPAPPAGTEAMAYREEPARARRFVRERAGAAGLREPKITDLVLAVGELAANTLRHTTGGGTVSVWGTRTEVICEVRDSGHIPDLLAGRLWPAADAGRGHGLWVVYQVCDLVEMRTNAAGTIFRLHMRLGSSGQ